MDERAASPVPGGGRINAPGADAAITLPIVEESLVVEKRELETGRVRVRTVVEEQEELLRDTVRRGRIEVERVPVGRFVDETPVIREEGDLIVVPVLEERAVVVKRLFLVEEVRLRRTTQSETVELPATRRVMRAVVEDTRPQQQGNE